MDSTIHIIRSMLQYSKGTYFVQELDSRNKDIKKMITFFETITGKGPETSIGDMQAQVKEIGHKLITS